jgi:hypothetical protein
MGEQACEHLPRAVVCGWPIGSSGGSAHASYLGQFVQELAAPLLRDRIHRPFGGRKASDQILDVLGYEKMSVVGAAGSDRLIEVAIGDDFTASMPGSGFVSLTG